MKNLKNFLALILTVSIVFSMFSVSALAASTGIFKKATASTVYGDLDGDGKVKMADVVIIQKSIANLLTLSSNQRLSADVDGNGEINMLDVVLVQQKIAEIIKLFPVEETSDTSTDTVTDSDTEPTDTDVKPTDSDTEPTDSDVKPTDSDTEPTDTDVKPTDSDTEPTDTDVKPTDSDTEPTDTDVKPTDSDIEPTDTDVKPTDSDTEPTDTEDNPTDSDGEKQFVLSTNVNDILNREVVIVAENRAMTVLENAKVSSVEATDADNNKILDEVVPEAIYKIVEIDGSLYLYQTITGKYFSQSDKVNSNLFDDPTGGIEITYNDGKFNIKDIASNRSLYLYTNSNDFRWYTTSDIGRVGDFDIYANGISIPSDPIDTDVKPTDSDTDPTDTDVKPTDSDTDPTDTDVKPTDSDTDPTDTDIKPTDSDTDPTDTDVKPTDSDTDPTDTDSEAEEYSSTMFTLANSLDQVIDNEIVIAVNGLAMSNVLNSKIQPAAVNDNDSDGILDKVLTSAVFKIVNINDSLYLYNLASNKYYCASNSTSTTQTDNPTNAINLTFNAENGTFNISDASNNRILAYAVSTGDFRWYTSLASNIKELEIYVDKNVVTDTDTSTDTSTDTNTDTSTDTDTSSERTIYFVNNWLWTDVNIYYYIETSDGTEEVSAWPGVAMNLTDQSFGTENYQVYSLTVPVDAVIIFNGIKNGSTTDREQSINLTLSDFEYDWFEMFYSNGEKTVNNFGIESNTQP